MIAVSCKERIGVARFAAPPARDDRAGVGHLSFVER